MGAVIGLLIGATVALVRVAVFVVLQVARVFVLVVARIFGTTGRLIQQRGAKRSPDGRRYWNGRAWMPVLSPVNWAIPAGALVGVMVIAGILVSAGNTHQLSNEQTASASSPSTESSPTNSEVQVTASPSTTTHLPTPAGAKCGNPDAHVYNPDRLQLLAACVTVTGTVAVIRSESDGDLHVLLRLDSSESKYINAKNISAQDDDLVLEPVCVDTPTQADAMPACAGYQNPIAIPAVGTHTAATGAWVLDLDHGWMELHPVFAFSAVGTSQPPPSAAPKAPAAPSPAPVNLCGAPANPWNYTFCSGRLITAPPSAFCSYFTCISSFWKGTGYVVQCSDGAFSKSGGHTGVCSTHGGFKRNLYSS